MKGIPNGVHEKKGNKRAPADVRLVSKIYYVLLDRSVRRKESNVCAYISN